MRLNRIGTLLSNHVRSKGEIAVTCFDLQGVRQSQTTIGGLYNHSFIIPFSWLLLYSTWAANGHYLWQYVGTINKMAEGNKYSDESVDAISYSGIIIGLWSCCLPADFTMSSALLLSHLQEHQRPAISMTWSSPRARLQSCCQWQSMVNCLDIFLRHFIFVLAKTGCIMHS